MNPLAEAGLFVLVLPAGCTAALLVAGGLGHHPQRLGRPWAAPTAISLAFVIAWAWTEGFHLPALDDVRVEGSRWLWMVIPAIALGVVEPVPERRPGWGFLRVAAAASVGAFVLRYPMLTLWRRPEGLAWLVAFTAGSLAWWAALVRLPGWWPMRGPGRVATLATVTAGAVVLIGASAKLAMPLLAMATACGTGALLGHWQPRFGVTRWGVAPVALLSATGVLCAVAFADLAGVSAMGLALMPPAALAASRSAWGRRGRGRWLAPLGATVLVGLISVALALGVRPSPSTDETPQPSTASMR